MRERARDEAGSAIIMVLLISLVAAGLTVLLLRSGEHANVASTKDRNYELALGAAEAGVDHVVALIHASGGSIASPTVAGAVATGRYETTVRPLARNVRGCRSVGCIEIESLGTSGSIGQTTRSRRIRVVLQPPAALKDLIFASGNLYVKNGLQAEGGENEGDIFANGNIFIENNLQLKGDVMAANGWVRLEQNTSVEGNVFAGNLCQPAVAPCHDRLQSSERFSASITNGAVDGDVTTYPGTGGCPHPTYGHTYDLRLGSGVKVKRATVAGQIFGGIVEEPPAKTSTCDGASRAPETRPIPEFRYNRNNYESVYEVDRDTFRASATVRGLAGTWYVQDSAPSQAAKLVLSGFDLNGDATIITNLPVELGTLNVTSPDAVLVVISTYIAGTADPCDESSGDCAIRLGNNTEVDCDKAAVLLYAQFGDIGVFNKPDYCGATYGRNVTYKNRPNLKWDERISRVVGFGQPTYVRTLFEELPVG